MRPGGAAWATCTWWTAVQLRWECRNKKGSAAFVSQAAQPGVHSMSRSSSGKVRVEANGQD